MESMQTRLAAAAAAAAAGEWKRHVMECGTCIMASGKRRGYDPCETGARLLDAKTETSAEARKQKELDRQPSPDQETLF